MANSTVGGLLSNAGEGGFAAVQARVESLSMDGGSRGVGVGVSGAPQHMMHAEHQQLDIQQVLLGYN